MVKAIWNNTILAESDKTIIIDRKHYFPPEDVNMEFLQKSDMYTVCPWKGRASYYDIVIGGKKNKDAVWYYPNPSEKALQIKGYMAFSYTHGVNTLEE